ncbi:DDE-type integrase/transposase/recombinase [Bradyrhizobium sp. WSM2793]|uniref:DDE-type integrase/transposase/recombinase n=1 Tax=Bradyrhizobium sp. WSM2793 TaxID=1038866 RepID=UPI003528D8F6
MSLSERRTCSIVGADRKLIRYHSSRPADAALRGWLREAAAVRLPPAIRPAATGGRALGDQSDLPAYREDGLTVRKRRARRKAVGTHAPILIDARPNARWSLDFVHDQFANGRRFRILNIVDDVTKQCLGAIPETSISGRRVARELTAIVERRGKPGMIVSDHGTEFTCKPCSPGARTRSSIGTLSRQESRCRKASSRVLMAGCAMNCSTRPCSSI